MGQGARSLSHCRTVESFDLNDTLFTWTDPDKLSDEEDKNRVNKNVEEQFACTICRGPFRNAVETMYVRRRQQDINAIIVPHADSFVASSCSCGHFFCEACALKHFKKSSRCFNCKKQTNGMQLSKHTVLRLDGALTVGFLNVGVFNAAEKYRAREREQHVDAVGTSNSTVISTIDVEANANAR